MRLSGKSWFWAVIALALALSFQAAVVRFQFQGEWTGLFYSGLQWPLPSDLSAPTFRHASSPGYDGQFYRLVAHDPFDAKGYSGYMDNATYRRKRILVPLLAWALAFGRGDWIDTAYFAVLHLTVFAGVWLFAQLAQLWLRHPAWGLAFLLMPATMNSLDRMLPDAALFAILAGYLLYGKRRPALGWALLASAVLVRDLGLLLVAAAAAAELWRHRWVAALIQATAAIPAVAWWAHCSAQGGGSSGTQMAGWLGVAPVTGFFIRMLHPVPYRTGFDWVFQTLDALVMLSLPAAAGMAVWLWWRDREGEIEWQALAGASLVVLASHPVFLADSASYPRAFSLLLCPLAMIALQTGRWAYALPCALLSLRLALALGGILLRSVLQSVTR